MRDQKPQSSGFQQQAAPPHANLLSNRPFEANANQGTETLTNTLFPHRPHEVCMGTPARKRDADAITESQTELEPAKAGVDFSRIGIYPPERTPNQPPQLDRLQTKRTVGEPSDRDDEADQFTAQPDLESQLSASQSGGSPLPKEVRSFMEPRFGADFSQVRVHTGSQAMQLNRELYSRQSHLLRSRQSPCKRSIDWARIDPRGAAAGWRAASNRRFWSDSPGLDDSADDSTVWWRWQW